MLLEDPKDLIRVVEFLRDSASLKIDYLSSITATDHIAFLETLYHFFSMETKRGPITLRVRVPRQDARIPSLVSLFKSADLQEREAFDLYGIKFEGHPDLRRLMMWEGYEDYPLRKDYEQEDADVLETADIQWLESHGVKVPDVMKTKAAELAAAGKRAVAEKPAEPRLA